MKIDSTGMCEGHHKFLGKSKIYIYTIYIHDS